MRRQREEDLVAQAAAAGLEVLGDDYVPFQSSAKRRRDQATARQGSRRRDQAAAEDDERKREEARQRTLQAAIDGAVAEEEAPAEAEKSLLDTAAELKSRQGLNPLAHIDRRAREEATLLAEVSNVQIKALVSAKEHATGEKAAGAITSSWRPFLKNRRRSEEANQKLRDKWRIITDGDSIPPPHKTFEEMRFPPEIMAALRAKGILRPTPIQVQGLPCVLAGRDMIGIAFTGSGKTMTFSLPAVMFAMEAEKKLALAPGEGPCGIILGPSRELQRQTFFVVEHFAKALMSKPGAPELRTLLCIGGENKREQQALIQQRGVHLVVATPGRLNDFLKGGQMNLTICTYICLDEADRMLDLGFDEEVKSTFNHFKHARQTLLFSATMPQKVISFAKESLCSPILVNVGRAGAANLDVIQEVEYVKQEAKIVYLLECLQKTAPPCVIFCERKGDVDDIHEYLLLKGVEAVSIHGSKEQEERNAAIDAFKEQTKDVLVATDVAAKGLDFPDVQHVINFDMPEEIENYVHRIGRTGRCGKTGVATTFINKEVPVPALLDLKHLLIEAKQRVPPVLLAFEDDTDGELVGGKDGVRGCAFCGGLGHRITDCPKIDKDARKLNAGKQDLLAGSGGVGGDW